MHKELQLQLHFWNNKLKDSNRFWIYFGTSNLIYFKLSNWVFKFKRNLQSHNLEVVDSFWNGNIFFPLKCVPIAHGVPKVLWNFCLQFKSIPKRFCSLKKKKKVLCFYFPHSSYSCILGNARSRPGAIIPEVALWSLGRLTDFTLTACFAEILYSSLTQYTSGEYHDTATFLFMFLLLQKLIVTPLQSVFLSIIICHIQYAFF